MRFYVTTLIRYFVLIGLCFLTIGFVLYIDSLPAPARKVLPATHGVVVIGNTAQVLQEGIVQLRDRQAETVLVIDTSHSPLPVNYTKEYGLSEDLVKCCLKKARSKVPGDAVVAFRRWLAEQEGEQVKIIYNVLDYHTTFRVYQSLFPDIEFIPYPVGVNGFNIHEWWGNSEHFRDIFTAYFNFLETLG